LALAQHGQIQGRQGHSAVPAENGHDVILENYVDDTHGFMRVEIEDDTITARYFAVPRPYEPPETPPRVADLFQLQFKSKKLVR
jgi:hypothetical protein